MQAMLELGGWVQMLLVYTHSGGLKGPLFSGSKINFFGYSPVGQVAIRIYSPDAKITHPT